MPGSLPGAISSYKQYYTGILVYTHDTEDPYVRQHILSDIDGKAGSNGHHSVSSISSDITNSALPSIGIIAASSLSLRSPI